MSDDQDGCEWVSFFWPTRVVPRQQPLNGCVCVYNYKLYLCHFITFKYSLRAMMTIGNERLVITPPQQFDTAFNAFIQKNCATHEF